MQTPWGKAQHVKEYPNGVIEVETASHGGFYVPDHLIGQVDPKWRAFAAEWSHGWGDQWFEEDSAAIGVIVSFPELFSAPVAEFAQRNAQGRKMPTGPLTPAKGNGHA